MTSDQIRTKIRELLRKPNLGDAVSFRNELKLNNIDVSALCRDLGRAFDEANFAPGISETLDSIQDFIDYLLPDAVKATAEPESVSRHVRGTDGEHDEFERRELPQGNLELYLRKHHLDALLGLWKFRSNVFLIRLESSGNRVMLAWISSEWYAIGEMKGEADLVDTRKMANDITIAKGDLLVAAERQIPYEMVVEFAKPDGNPKLHFRPSSSNHRPSFGRVELSADRGLLVYPTRNEEDTETKIELTKR